MQAPATAPATASEQAPTKPMPQHAVPWYKNQILGGVVGVLIVVALNRWMHLGLPQTGALAVAGGLLLLWAVHVIAVDVAAHKGPTGAQVGGLEARVGDLISALFQHLSASEVAAHARADSALQSLMQTVMHLSTHATPQAATAPTQTAAETSPAAPAAAGSTGEVSPAAEVSK